MSTASVVALSIPRDYGYVLLTATGTFWLTVWHGLRIAPFRKAAGIAYPTAYAPAEPTATATSSAADAGASRRTAYLFNCAVRSQANYLESYPSVLAALLLGGLQYPVVASGLGVFWGVCRVLYATGYTDPTKENGKGRGRGAGHYLAQLGLYSLSGLVGWNLLRA